MIPISVVILTRNEELFVERCINSAIWADEILVLDSHSTDKTREIARSLGATVYEHEWMGGYAIQRHKAITLAKNDWVFVLDCDEIITTKLMKSIQNILNSAPSNDNGFSVNRPGDFYGVLLPNSAIKSRELVRLFNRKVADYSPNIDPHTQIKVPGKVISLNADMLHWRAYIMKEYVSSINSFTDVESIVMNEKGIKFSVLRLFLKPIVRFSWCYLFCGEFRLGTRGLVHAMLMATAEFIRQVKLWEIQKAPRVLHPDNRLHSFSIHDKELVNNNELMQKNP
jgi:(heptosyl)LPS beta-1,4-glucosyltransferase